MLRWMRAKRRKRASAVTAAATLATSDLVPSSTMGLLPAVEQVERVQRAQTTLGMQGYAPVITISRNRRYCEYCAERVLASVRHVCWGNAEHHMHTLSAEERARILAQLASKPVKLTRAQLKKLYKADGLGPARY